MLQEDGVNVFGNFEDYKRRFEETKEFFEVQFEEAGKLGSEMWRKLKSSGKKRKEETWGIE